jgi:indolepyruvate ferredoxin oxidoreductase
MPGAARAALTARVLPNAAFTSPGGMRKLCRPGSYTAERRGERAAIGDFEALMRQIVAALTPDRLKTALELARLPQSVRGFGHVKERNAANAQRRQQQLLAVLTAPQAAQLRPTTGPRAAA